MVGVFFIANHGLANFFLFKSWLEARNGDSGFYLISETTQHAYLHLGKNIRNLEVLDKVQPPT